MIDARPEASLGDAVARVLVARGEDALAAIVTSGRLELAPHSETWMLDHRSVEAQRFALVVAPEEFVWLKSHPERIEALRDAVAGVVDTPTTRLANLSVVVGLVSPSGAENTWAGVYRTASPVAAPPPEPAEVAATAEALAEAYGDPIAAGMLARADLERAVLSEASGIASVRWIVRLTPADLVAAERSVLLTDRLVLSVTHAATRASERVGEVELRARATGDLDVE